MTRYIEAMFPHSITMMGFDEFYGENIMNNKLRFIAATTIAGASLMASTSVFADKDHGHGHGKNKATCKAISYKAFTAAVDTAYEDTLNTGSGNGMWAALVDQTGKVCWVYSVVGKNATANGGEYAGNSAWLGSRVISAQKANTANAFSLDNSAISSGALTVATYEGGSLYGLETSNPIDGTKAYKGPAQRRGKKNDPLVGKDIGGVNLFGGGVAIYNTNGIKMGAVGVSGDTSCRDHSMAYRLRIALGLDNNPNDDGLELSDPPTQIFQQPSCGTNDPLPTTWGDGDDNGIRGAQIQPI